MSPQVLRRLCGEDNDKGESLGTNYSPLRSREAACAIRRSGWRESGAQNLIIVDSRMAGDLGDAHQTGRRFHN